MIRETLICCETRKQSNFISVKAKFGVYRNSFLNMGEMEQ